MSRAFKLILIVSSVALLAAACNKKAAVQVNPNQNVRQSQQDTLSGVDADDNGVRDDIDIYI